MSCVTTGHGRNASERSAPTASVLTRSRPTESHRNRRPACWQCDDTGHLTKECPCRPAKEVVGKRDWTRDYATAERSNASRKMAESIPLLDEKQWPDGRTLALEGEIKGLRVPTAELEAALERKTGGQRRVTCRTVRADVAFPFSPKEGAPGQRPSESSLEPSDQFGRVQRT
jgi:hypothetical protein